MSEREEQQEDDPASIRKENALFFAGAVIIFNIILVILWVVYIFHSYEDYTRFHHSFQQFTMFDSYMKHSVAWDIAFGIVLNILFMGCLSSWLTKFRSERENPRKE